MFIRMLDVSVCMMFHRCACPSKYCLFDVHSCTPCISANLFTQAAQFRKQRLPQSNLPASNTVDIALAAMETSFSVRILMTHSRRLDGSSPRMLVWSPYDFECERLAEDGCGDRVRSVRRYQAMGSGAALRRCRAGNKEEDEWMTVLEAVATNERPEGGACAKAFKVLRKDSSSCGMSPVSSVRAMQDHVIPSLVLTPRVSSISFLSFQTHLCSIAIP